MVVAEPLNTAQIRITSYYLKKLGYINNVFNKGGENAIFSLQTFDQEWEQIRKWRNWAVENAVHNAEAARIAAAFPRLGNSILKMRLNNQEFLEWNKTGFECSERLHDDQFRLEELLNLAFAYQRMYDYDNANVYAHMTLDFCDPENLYDSARAYNCLGIVERRLGNMKEARNYLEKSLALYQTCGDLEQSAAIHYNLSSLAGMEGDFPRARNLLQLALPFYRRIGDLHYVSNCLNNLGLVEYSEGNLDPAHDYLRESLEVSEQINYRSNMAQALTNLAAVENARGNYEAVIIHETRSLALSQELGDTYGIAMSMNNLGKIAFIRSQLDTAEAHFRDALALIEQMNDRYSTVECLYDLGQCAQVRGHHEQAENLYQQGVTNAKAVNHQTGLIDNLRALAKLYIKLQRFGEARAALYQGLMVAVEIQSHLYQLRILLTSAQLWSGITETTTAGRWLGFAYTHYSTEPRIRQEMDEIQKSFSEDIGDSKKVEALMEEGSQLILENVIDELMTQLRVVSM